MSTKYKFALLCLTSGLLFAIFSPFSEPRKEKREVTVDQIGLPMFRLIEEQLEEYPEAATVQLSQRNDTIDIAIILTETVEIAEFRRLGDNAVRLSYTLINRPNFNYEVSIYAPGGGLIEKGSRKAGEREIDW